MGIRSLLKVPIRWSRGVGEQFESVTSDCLIIHLSSCLHSDQPKQSVLVLQLNRRNLNMSSSESESSLSCVEDRNGSDMDSSSESEFGAIASVFQPYMDEPLAPLRQDQDDGDEEAARQDENVDTDGLSRQELEARYEKEKPVGDWCTYTKCKDDILVGSREIRCCREVAEAYGKVVFEGLQDTCVCVIQHDDFAAVTNTTNLKMVAPLLKDREGKKYRKKADQTENE